MYAYPTSDLDAGQNLLALIGSFWNRVYAGKEQVERYCDALAMAAKQAERDMLEAVAAASRFTVPVFHTENWHLLYLRESQRRPDVFRYDDGLLNYDGIGSFGAPRPDDRQGAVTFPAGGVQECSFIFNRLTVPSKTLTHGQDFTVNVDDDSVVFGADPFSDPLWPARDVIDTDGAVIDREIAMWLFKAKFDWHHLHMRFGYAVGMTLHSSEASRDLLNAVMDAIVGGTSLYNVVLAMSAITGIPVSRNPGEVVERIDHDARNLLIITDREAYRFPLGARPDVMLGDVLDSGDTLVDAFKVSPLNYRRPPDWLHSLAIGPGILGGRYLSDITFEWIDDSPLIVESVHGRTKVSWELGGFPADVDKFWDVVHDRGITSGQTLADLLTFRERLEGEPTAADLPRTINPLLFLTQHFLGSNTLFIRIKSGLLGDGAPGLDAMQYLRKIIPPHTLLITIIEMPVLRDSVTMAPDASNSGDAAAFLLETAPTPSDRIGCRDLSGGCPT